MPISVSMLFIRRVSQHPLGLFVCSPLVVCDFDGLKTDVGRGGWVSFRPKGSFLARLAADFAVDAIFVRSCE